MDEACGAQQPLRDLVGALLEEEAAELRRRQREVVELFQLHNEEVLGDFACALSKSLLLSGRLYVTSSHICFYSDILGMKTKEIIPLQSVVAVDKGDARTNAIVVLTRHNEEHFFSSFLTRGRVYYLIRQAWLQHKASAYRPTMRGYVNTPAGPGALSDCGSDGEAELGDGAASPRDPSGGNGSSSGVPAASQPIAIRAASPVVLRAAAHSTLSPPMSPPLSLSPAGSPPVSPPLSPPLSPHTPPDSPPDSPPLGASAVPPALESALRQQLSDIGIGTPAGDTEVGTVAVNTAVDMVNTEVNMTEVDTVVTETATERATETAATDDVTDTTTTITISTDTDTDTDVAGEGSEDGAEHEETHGTTDADGSGSDAGLLTRFARTFSQDQKTKERKERMEVERLRRMFDLPADEDLVDDFSCALLKNSFWIIQGRIFLFKSHACFHANIVGKVTRVVVPLRDIVTITLENTAIVFPNAINVVTGDGKEYFFTSFIFRDKTYELLSQLWKISRARAGEHVVPSPAPHARTRPRPHRHDSLDTGAGSRSAHDHDHDPDDAPSPLGGLPSLFRAVDKEHMDGAAQSETIQQLIRSESKRQLDNELLVGKMKSLLYQMRDHAEREQERRAKLAEQNVALVQHIEQLGAQLRAERKWRQAHEHAASTPTAPPAPQQPQLPQQPQPNDEALADHEHEHWHEDAPPPAPHEQQQQQQPSSLGHRVLASLKAFVQDLDTHPSLLRPNALEGVKDHLRSISWMLPESSPWQPPVDDCYIERLPDEVMLTVFASLDPKALGRAMRVCRRWYQLCNDPMVWKDITMKRFPKCNPLEFESPRMVSIPATAEEAQRREQEALAEEARTGTVITRPSQLLLPLPPGCYDWKWIYSEKDRVETNWKRGRYKVRTLRCHSEPINAVDLHHTCVLTASEDETAMLWDVRELSSKTRPMLRPRHVMRHSGAVLTGVLWKNLIVTSSWDETVAIWSQDTGESLRVMRGHTDSVECLCVDGAQVVSGSWDKTVCVWDVESGALLRTLTHGGAVFAVAVHADYIVTACGDNQLYVWDRRDGELIGTLAGHTDTVKQLRVWGDLVVSASADTTARVWSLATMACVCTLQHEEEVLCVFINARYIVSGSRDKSMSVVSTVSLERVFRLRGHAGAVLCVRVMDMRLVSGAADKTMRVWDLARGKCTLVLRGHAAPVVHLTFDEDRLVSSSEDNTVKVWDFSYFCRGREMLGVEHEAVEEADDTERDCDMEVNTGLCVKS